MNSKIKKGLGRGLSSLIGETKVETKTNKLLLSEIIPNKYQPRKNFDEENLDDLTNSIKERGVIQPIIVRRSVSNDSKYEIKTDYQYTQKKFINYLNKNNDLKKTFISLDFGLLKNLSIHTNHNIYFINILLF